MAKPFKFDEFEDYTATVQAPTQVTDDLMGVTNTFATRTSVGTSGSFVCGLQTLSGSQQQFAARNNMTVDYVAFPAAGTANVMNVANGDRLVIGGTNYNVVWRGLEGGTSNSPVIYLQRID